MPQSSPNHASDALGIMPALSLEFYRDCRDMEQVDKVMWHNVNALLPKDDQLHAGIVKLLDMLPTGLRNYYLARNFDDAVNDQGMFACLWMPPDEDYYFPKEAALAYKALGAVRQAALIDELWPKAQQQRIEVQQAETEGTDYEADDALWLESEEQWLTANQEFSFYEAVWKDLRAHPERYVLVTV